MEPSNLLSAGLIREALKNHTPNCYPSTPDRQAAVAMVLSRLPRLQLLFIERARDPADPWSGHIALPGGRREPKDTDAYASATRETLEEVGIDLSVGEHLGRVDDMGGRSAGPAVDLVISCFVFLLERPPPVTLSHEVEETIWVPLDLLLDPDAHLLYPHPPTDSLDYPAIRIGGGSQHLVWGLTHRFLTRLFKIIGFPLPMESRIDP